MKNFKVYSSSAGSGKTYTLTKEYLKLALQNEQPDYFRHILAITFTNDAANEMKERIIKTLQLFGQTQGAENEMLHTIAQELGIAPEIIQERAKKVFNKIIYNYADFSVSTIDKFVNRVAAAFTQELNIPYNYEIDLDTELLLNTAIDRVLERVGREKEENLSSIILDWAREKTEKGQKWQRIAKDLHTFSKDLMSENTYDFINQVKKLSIQDLQVINTQVKHQKEVLVQDMQQNAQNALNLIQRYGLTEKDFFQGKNGVYHFFEKCAQGKFPTPNSYVKKTYEQNHWTTQKQNTSLTIIQTELHEYLSQIMEQIPDYQFFEMIAPNMYQLALIQEIETELQEVKRENSTIHIADTNRKIAEIISKEPVPFIYERVGEKYNHILIDEFQDTSILQWENLLPLIENNLGEGHFNLLVGDAKQAIYRWRGGEMEQLVFLYKNQVEKLIEKSKLPTEFLEERYQTLSLNHTQANLKANFRSSHEIIDFNNDFFQTIVQEKEEIFPFVKEIYDKNFAQQIPLQNNKTGGHIEFFLPPKDKDYQQITFDEILRIIIQVQEEGFQLKDIAILARNNKDAKEIANFLKNNQLEVISQISLLLQSEPKVNFIVSMLQIINTPEDKLLRAETLYLFFIHIKKQIPDSKINQTIRETISQPIAALYQLLAENGYETSHYQLLQLSLYELAEKIIEIFKLLEDKQSLAYIFRFLDVILAFSLQKNTTLTDFLQFWEDKKNDLSINTPKDNNAITVTSIHKSKGLEYPIVIIPFTDWSVEPNTRSLFWVQLPDNKCFVNPSTQAKLSFIALPFNKNLAEIPFFAQKYKVEMEKTFIENLNLLYVAFTRPIYRLYVLGHQTFIRNNPQKNINYLLYQYLKSIQVWEENKTQFIIKKGEKLLINTPQIVHLTSFMISNFITTDLHKKVKKIVNKK